MLISPKSTHRLKKKKKLFIDTKYLIVPEYPISLHEKEKPYVSFVKKLLVIFLETSEMSLSIFKRRSVNVTFEIFQILKILVSLM